jgi:hypothetical protein
LICCWSTRISSSVAIHWRKTSRTSSDIYLSYQRVWKLELPTLVAL